MHCIRFLFIVFPDYFSPGASVTPANSGSIMMRPQYSQTITFLCIFISICFCGGMRLKQPPQALRWIYTMPRPLRAFLRIRLNAANVRVSIRGSRDLAFSRSDSSSCRVSDTISSSSDFFSWRMCSWSLSDSRVASISAVLFSMARLKSFMCFSHSSISVSYTHLTLPTTF